MKLSIRFYSIYSQIAVLIGADVLIMKKLKGNGSKGGKSTNLIEVKSNTDRCIYLLLNAAMIKEGYNYAAL